MIYCAAVFFVINHMQQLIHLLVFGIVHISVSSVYMMHTGIYSNAQSVRQEFQGSLVVAMMYQCMVSA